VPPFFSKDPDAGQLYFYISGKVSCSERSWGHPLKATLPRAIIIHAQNRVFCDIISATFFTIPKVSIASGVSLAAPVRNREVGQISFDDKMTVKDSKRQNPLAILSITLAVWMLITVSIADVEEYCLCRRVDGVQRNWFFL
jgi:hypothetical protein